MDNMKAYVEFEGDVFTVKNGNLLSLPEFKGEQEFKDEFGFSIKKAAEINDNVLFFDVVEEAKPVGHWILKDDMLRMENIEADLRDAIIMSYQRVIVCVVILKNKKLLLVKPKAGLAQEKWILPGGFLRYAESPGHGCMREAREELGVRIKIGKLLGVYETHSKNDYNTITVAYSGKLSEKGIKASNEIGKIGWFSAADALKACSKKGATAQVVKSLGR